ncbi:protein phosphatase 2C domain-containing protein [Bacillus sp. B15-48]|uniref:protein phosphatase 2C domain-containing protein n=1 Tax=Bacillus sp. B15-48 TaxID=1548601 RepID=UPI00193FC2FC|nr:protein phosphatase 2C domain-containing protein [Bacillus sp. B15-48]
MFNQIEYIHEKGSNHTNEDAYILKREEGLFAVIDGATGLGGLPGSLAATTIKDSIEEMPLSKSLIESTQLANKILGQKTLKVTKAQSMKDILKERRSSCGLAAVKITKDTLQMEYVQTGDCMLFLQLTNGDIRMISYDHLSPLDSVSISKFHHLLRLRSKDVEMNESIFQECRGEILDTLVENRRKMNTSEGYGVLDGSRDANEHIEYGLLSLKKVKKILLLSDGLQLPTKKASGQQAWLETASFAFKSGLAQLYNHVHHLETGDPYCLAYPRLKLADDKTGILISLISSQ